MGVTTERATIAAIVIIVIIAALYLYYKYDRDVQCPRKFFDVGATYPSLNGIRKYEPEIFAEYARFARHTEGNRGGPYDSWLDWPEKYLYNQSLTNDWKIFPIYAFGKWNDMSAFPKLAEFLHQIDGLKMALISRLGPHTALVPHQGWGAYSNHVLRCHYGLVIPKHTSDNDGCYISVADTWERDVDGRLVTEERVQHLYKDWIIFDDSMVHWATNDTDEARVVLIVDIERPSHVPDGVSTVAFSEELVDVVRHFKAT